MTRESKALGRPSLWLHGVALAGTGALFLLAALSHGQLSLRVSSAGAAEVDAHHVRAADIPAEEFTRDLANVLDGTVTGPGGAPAVGALVEVFHKQDLFAALGTAEEPAPAASTRTGPDGAFRFPGLPYGSKFLRATMAGTEPHVVEEVVTLDGSGATGVRMRLDEAQAAEIQLVGAPESVAEDLSVRARPEGLLGSWQVLETGADLTFTLPADVAGGAFDRFHLAVGSPAFSTTVGRRTTEIQLPDAGALTVEAEGLEVGAPYELWLLPRGALTSGARSWTRVAASPSETIVTDAIWHGAYTACVVQSDRGWSAEIEHDGSPLSAALGPRHSIEVVPEDGAGAPWKGSLSWRWQPSRPEGLGSAAADAKGIADQADPLCVRGRSKPGAAIRIEGAFGDAGWLEVYGPESGHALLQLAPDLGTQRLVLDRVPAVVRTHLPFLPVHVESPDGWSAVFEANAFGEVRMMLAREPHLVRSRFSRGGPSVVKGLWPGPGAPPLRFSKADVEPERSVASVHGFVSAGGAPLEGAQVVRGRKRAVTDAHGLYSMADVRPGAFGVAARADSAGTGVLWTRTAAVPGSPSDVRVDIEVGTLVHRLEGLPAEARGVPLRLEFLSAEAGASRPVMVEPATAGELLLRGLKPGRYVLEVARPMGGSIGNSVEHQAWSRTFEVPEDRE